MWRICSISVKADWAFLGSRLQCKCYENICLLASLYFSLQLTCNAVYNIRVRRTTSIRFHLHFITNEKSSIGLGSVVENQHVILDENKSCQLISLCTVIFVWYIGDSTNNCWPTDTQKHSCGLATDYEKNILKYWWASNVKSSVSKRWQNLWSICLSPEGTYSKLYLVDIFHSLWITHLVPLYCVFPKQYVHCFVRFLLWLHNRFLWNCRTYVPIFGRFASVAKG